MNIQEATKLAIEKDCWIGKRDRTDEWCLYVAAGNVFRDKNGDQVDLDARDCLGDDWYLID